MMAKIARPTSEYVISEHTFLFLCSMGRLTSDASYDHFTCKSYMHVHVVRWNM